MKKLLAIVVLGLLWSGSANALPKCKGDDRSKWMSCLGTHFNSSKTKIISEYGKSPGVVDGKFLYENKKTGLFFKGNKKKDKMNGHYSLKINHKDGGRSKITGFALQNSKFIGKSEDHWNNGDKMIFIGEFSGPMTPKKGTLFYIVDDERYFGESLDFYPHGIGHLTYKDGSKYYGELKYFKKSEKSKRHGKGTLTYLNGKIEKGIWKEDDLIK